MPFPLGITRANWGIITAAVKDPVLYSRPGGLTQFIWELVKQEALARGEVLTGVHLEDVNSLVSRAFRNENANRSLASKLGTYMRTGIDQSITRSEIGEALGARDLRTQGFFPAQRVRYPVEVLREGVPTTVFKTLDLTGPMTDSVGTLLDRVQAKASLYHVPGGEQFLGLAGAPELEAF